MLNLNNNQLEALPEEIGQLHDLLQLRLNNNELKTLQNVEGLTGLEVLHVKNNQLTAIPEEVKNLPHLNLLEFENNPIEIALLSEPESVQFQVKTT